MTTRRLALTALLFSISAHAQSDAPVLVQAEAQTVTPVCTGHDVRIEGNHNVVKLVGVCRSLLLKGVANQVSLDLGPSATIRVEGSDNHVDYHAAGSPGIEALGPNNMVTRVAGGGPAASGSTPAGAAAKPAPSAGQSAAVAPASAPKPVSNIASAPPPPESVPPKSMNNAGQSLDLTGEDQAQATDCAGRDVNIRGARALYLLRGGCRSLTIHGDLVTVQAELAPKAAIAITGHGDRVGWALAGRGHAPVETIHGEANHIERLDELGGLPVR